MVLIDMVTAKDVYFNTNEKLALTFASCILMAHDNALSPRDAVLDVMQVYKEIKDHFKEE